MSVLDDNERTEYLRSPYFKKHEYGDFKPFYITIAVFSVVLFVLFVINIVLGCCSRYSEYWNDRHTGNRWIVSLWTATPRNQPSLDYTELNPDLIPTKIVYETPSEHKEYTDLDTPRQNIPQLPPTEFLEMTKRESDI